MSWRDKPITEKRNDMYYYCSMCRKWYVVASTQGALCPYCRNRMISYYDIMKAVKRK